MVKKFTCAISDFHSGINSAVSYYTHNIQAGVKVNIQPKDYDKNIEF